MKKLTYLIFLLLCLAGCKKTEVAAIRVNFAKIIFTNATKLQSTPKIKYDGVTYGVGSVIPTPYGEQQFAFYKINGEKILDTTLSVSGPLNYFIYQPDTLKAAVLLTELPPPPPPPPGPLDDAGPAPDGYLQIKMSQHLKAILGAEKIDIQILAAFNTSGVYELWATMPNVTADYNNDFFLLKKPVRGGRVQTNYKFSFVISDTQQPVRNAAGDIYITTLASLATTEFNAYALNFDYVENADPAYIPKDGITYEAYPDIQFFK